jgi:hypothetical protein
MKLVSGRRDGRAKLKRSAVTVKMDARPSIMQLCWVASLVREGAAVWKQKGAAHRNSDGVAETESFRKGPVTTSFVRTGFFVVFATC